MIRFPLQPSHWNVSAYPDETLVHQEGLGSSKTVTGYLLDDISTAVLSIPNFDGDVESSSSVFGRFIRDRKSSGKVIFDLQQNTGEGVALVLAAYPRVRSLERRVVTLFRRQYS
jgi:hypothetical protein